MTFYAGAEGVMPTAHDTEEEAVAAAEAIGSKGQVWEIDERRTTCGVHYGHRWHAWTRDDDPQRKRHVCDGELR